MSIDESLPHLFPVSMERAFVGALLTAPSSLDRVVAVVLPQDVSHGEAQSLYRSMVNRWERGADLDYISIADEATVDARVALEMMNQFPSVSSISTYADRIVHAARLRRIAIKVADTSQAINSGQLDDPDEACGALREIEVSDEADRLDSAMTTPMHEWLATAKPDVDQGGEWVIPGFLRQRWRVIFAGEEGLGKSVFLRQVAFAVAAGRSPFSPDTPITPKRVLHIDVENPTEIIVEHSGLIDLHHDLATEAGDRLRLHHREQGMNLAEAADRRRFEALVMEARPDLLITGPMYKLARRRDGRSDWDADAMDLINFFDHIRTRFNCALLLEQHLVNTKEGSRFRRPEHAGSAMWRRWPEMAFSMMEHEDCEDGTRAKLVRYRRSRSVDSWPVELMQREGRGTGYAWQAKFDYQAY